MNFPLVSRLLGVVMLILSLAFGLCLVIAFWLDTSENASRQAFVLAAGISVFAAGLFFWIGRKHTHKFFRKEALAVIGIGWILASLLGSIPYIVMLPEIGFSGAIFEGTSGLTTTGASVLTNLEDLPVSLLFWRALSQWIGGMGVVVFFVAILGFLGAGARLLYANEASGSVSEFDDSRVQSTVSKLIYLYIGLSVLCALAYRAAGMNWFDAICHMFTTVSTGGFSTRSESIAAFNSPMVEWVTIAFMIIGAISFLLILRFISGRLNTVRSDTEFRAFITILVFSIIAVFGVLYFDHEVEGAEHAFRAATFQTVSVMTTSGFATEDFAAWSALPQALLIGLMVIGGCSGSTSGGLKVVRIIVVIRLCLSSIERSFRSRVVRPVYMNGRTVSDQAAQEMVMYVALNLMILILGLLLVSLFETTHALDTAISAVPACFLNVGPGIAEVGPTETYAFFHPHTKLFLSLLMIMGRLEMYAVLALFHPSFWKRFS